MLNSILDFIANHPFIVLFSCLFTMAVMAYIGAHIRRYENAYEIPHVFSNAIILVIIAYGCLLSYGVSQTHVETAKAPAYKALDMRQTIVFKSPKGKSDNESDEIIENFAYTFGLSARPSDLTIDTTKPVSQEMVRFLQSNERRNITMVTSDHGKPASQLVTIDDLIIKGDITSGNPIKITKVAFRKPVEHYLNLLGTKVQFGNDPEVKGSVVITIESE